MSSHPRPVARRARLLLEELEPREVLTGFEPTAQEQLFLERLNDARANPPAYGQSIGLDLAGVAAAPPLAFNTLLIQASRQHSQDMAQRNYFAHNTPEGVTPHQRVNNAGFTTTTSAESLGAGFGTPVAALQGLVIDEGVPDLGHRRHLLAISDLARAHNQVGIGVVLGGGGNFNNYYTINTALGVDTRPLITGVVYSDTNGNRLYDPGEGLPGVTITLTGGRTTTTFASGGYSIQVDPGNYTVTASGGGLAAPELRDATVVADNVRVNFTPAPTRIIVAPDEGGPPTVKIFNTDGSLFASFDAYGSSFRGGVRVAAADITGDGNPEIFTAPGPTGSPFVNIFNGVGFALLRQFQVYGDAFTLGVNLAVGNVLGDARPEIVVAPERGGEPFINIVDSDTGQQLRSFLAYGQTFTLGVRLALANTDATNGALLEVLTAPQAGGGPFINQFNAAAAVGQNTFLRSNQVFGNAFTGGLFLAGGNVNNTGLDDFIVGPGSSGDPYVNGFDGTTGDFVKQVQAYGLTFRAGVRVALADVNADGTTDIITGPGSGGEPFVQIINGLTQAQLRSILTFPTTMTAGLFVLAIR